MQLENATTKTALALALTLACAIVITMSTAAAAEVTDTEARAATTSTVVTKQVRPDRRPPVFVNALALGAVMIEDGDNRLTNGESLALATPGLALRVGGVIDDRHLLGALFQLSWRQTRDVADAVGDDRQSGSISSYFVGPEYRYATDRGVYFGAAAGFAVTLGDDHVGGRGEPDCSSFDCAMDYMRSSDDQVALAFGVRGVVGYEYRIKRHFAVNTEAFVGVAAGEDEDEQSMTTATFGLAFGVGI